MALELSELRAFLVLADHLHFSHAAEVLHVSQPALTKQMQRLAAKVAGRLLVRGYRKVALTPAGEILRDRAGSVLRQPQVPEQVVRLPVNGKAGVLRIGFGIGSVAAGLPDMLMRFRQQFPDVQVFMRDMSTPNQIEALHQGEIDVGFVRLRVESAELVTVPVLEEMLVAAIPRGMPCRKGLPDLRNEPFVVISRSSSVSFFDHLVQTCRAAGFSPRIVQEVNELLTVLFLDQAGAGVSLVPSSASRMRVPNVRLLDTHLAEAKWKIGLTWRKRDQSDPLVRNFVGLARRLSNAAPRV